MLQGSFDLNPKSRKNVLSIFGSTFRSFRHTLTVKYILPFKAKPKILEDPPAIYSFIKKDHWDQFVASRLSEKFTVSTSKVIFVVFIDLCYLV